MPKAKHGQHGQQKSEWLRTRITPTGKQGLEELATQMGISVSELLERLGRKQIQLSLGER